jgi:hypothetical protein
MADEDKALSQPDAPHTAGVMERFDLADDAKIVSALSKRVTQGFTYKVNGKFGLSSSGALWAAREFAKQGEVYRVVGGVDIKLCPLDPECVNITVIVQRFFVNPGTGQEIALDSTVGHKRMSRKTKRYTDDNDPTKFEMVEDPEFVTKAITKAERNGKLKLMPKDAVTNLIAKATGQPAPGAPAKGVPAKPATPPAGFAKPATPAAASAPASSAPPASAAPKPEEQAKAAPAAAAAPAPAAAQPVAPAQPGQAAPAAPAGKPKMSKEVMVQKLDAVSKMIFTTQDGAIARQKLSALTGKASPADLSDEDIKKIGNAINAVAKKTATIEGNNIVKTSDKSLLWKGPEIAAPVSVPAEAPEEEMF